MLRLPFVALANLLLLVRTLLGLPFRLMAARHRPAWVRFRLTGNPPYRERRRPRLPWGGEAPEPASVTSLESFRRALQLLARDPKVKGILLELEGLEVSLARRDALVGLLADFRAAGKRVVAWAVTVDTDAYPVMCAADEVLLAPMGRVDLVGYSAEAMALGGALERAGIRAHFVRRGDYKTAPELYTHAHVSDIQRQTIEALLDERYTALVDAVARGRRKTPEEVRALIDNGPYSARRARDAGLVDGLVSEVGLPAHLGLAATAPDAKGPGDAPTAHDDEPEPLEPLSTYLGALPFPPVRWRPFRRRPRLGLVAISGAISPGKGGGGRVASADAVVKALRQAARDRRTKAVLLHVSSPGGSALASEQILEAVKRLAGKKPVLAYVDQVCASGGYLAAMGAKELWSSPHAIVGSIGVYSGKFDVSGLMEWLGVRHTLITRGENAGVASMSRGFTPHELATMEADAEETYQDFLAHVARARGRTKEEIHALAEGRVYSGQRAKDAGLVDRIASFEEACRYALGLAKVTTERYELTRFGAAERRMSLLKLLSSVAQTRVYALCLTSWSLSGNLSGLWEPERLD